MIIKLPSCWISIRFGFYPLMTINKYRYPVGAACKVKSKKLLSFENRIKARCAKSMEGWIGANNFPEIVWGEHGIMKGGGATNTSKSEHDRMMNQSVTKPNKP